MTSIILLTPAKAAEARRETRQGAEGDEEGDGATGHTTASAYDCASHMLSRKALYYHSVLLLPLRLLVLRPAAAAQQHPPK